MVRIDAAIGQDQDRRAVAHRLGRGCAQLIDGLCQARFAFGDVEQHRQRDRAQIADCDLREAFPDRRCSGSAA